MTAKPAPTTGLVATLDHNRTVALDQIPAQTIAHLLSRIVSPQHRETTVEVASFNSSI